MGIRSQLAKVFAGTVPAGTAVDISVPEREEQGHYSTNIAFRLGKEQGRNPLEAAKEIAAAAAAAAPDLIERATAVAPGFVNVWVAKSAFAREVLRATGHGYGPDRVPAEEQQKIQLEFISANPTGPLTLANGRGGFLGDALANALEAVGHRVEREYYVNDTGNQVATFGKSLLAAAGFIPDEETFYKGAYVKEWADTHADTVSKHQDDPEALGKIAAADFLAAIKGVVEGMAGIRFDRYTSEERDIHAKGYLDRVKKVFAEKKISYEQEGALWLRTTDYGDDKDRVLVKTDGVPTYFLADAGHYLETLERGFDEKINILGPDHYGYVARIQAVAQILGLKKSEVVITQAVRLMRGGEEVKMSKRKGEFVTFGELVEEVGRDAARFFFLMTAPESHMDFDLALAAERSNKNPVFYAQYAAVRAGAILKKTGVPWFVGLRTLAPLDTAEDLVLMRKIAQYPEVVADAAAARRVHRLAQYALELARTFHAFYEKERVVGEPRKIRRARATLVLAARNVFKSLFGILGVSLPEKM